MPRGADPSRSATDALFVTDPREFVRARNALAAELARAGRAEEAAAVKRLPRLALPAWVLNRLARDAPEEVAALLATGERLRSAQSEALGGGGGGRLRAEMAELGRALARLRERAQGVLAGAGHPTSAAVLQRVEAGLRAAAAAGGDPAQQLRAGRLSREPEDSGLAALASTRAPSAAARSARGAQHLEPRRDGSRAAALERKRQESERRRAEAVARQRARETFRAQRRAGEEAARLDREAARLARAAEDAARKAEDAAKAAREARNRAEHARREAEALRAAASQPPTVH